jgi:predicted DCC family thiol-disulfide oxidoreductase YuxK
VLFDGVCNLCNASVGFIVDRDRRGYFSFAALQSEAGRRRLASHGPLPESMDSIVLLEDGRLYSRSRAALRIARRLDGLWPLLFALSVVPVPIADAVYAWVARRRYRWFGRTEACRVPTPALKGRFLDG